MDEDKLERVWKRDFKDRSYDYVNSLKKMQILVCGTIEPPKLISPKSVFDSRANQKLIPIALKQVGGTQKF